MFPATLIAALTSYINSETLHIITSKRKQFALNLNTQLFQKEELNKTDPKKSIISHHKNIKQKSQTESIKYMYD